VYLSDEPWGGALAGQGGCVGEDTSGFVDLLGGYERVTELRLAMPAMRIPADVGPVISG